MIETIYSLTDRIGDAAARQPRDTPGREEILKYAARIIMVLDDSIRPSPLAAAIRMHDLSETTETLRTRLTSGAS